LSAPSLNFSHNCKKAIKSTSTSGPPCIVHLKKKSAAHFENNHFKPTKKRYTLRTATSTISESMDLARQLKLSKCDMNPRRFSARVKRINSTTQQNKCRKLFESFQQRFIVIILFRLLTSYTTC